MINNTKNTFKAITKAPRNRISDKKEDSASMQKIIEIDGLCEMLNIGKNTAYNLLTSGEIDSFKVGSVWKIPVASVNDYIDRKCRESKLVKMYTVVNENRDLYYERHGAIPLRFR